MKNTFLATIFRVFIKTIAIAFLALSYYVNLAVAPDALGDLMDFGSFIAAGKFARQGENPYSGDSPLIFDVEFPKIGHSGIAPNLNPPISVMFFEPLADLPSLISAQVWRGLSLIFYIFLFVYLTRFQTKPRPALLWRGLWVFGLAGFWHALELGQLYTFLLLFVAGAVINIEKGKQIPAGILIGILIAIKPNFVFWAFTLWVAGYWQLFLWAGITAAAISLVPVFFYGFEIYTRWLAATRLFTPDLLIFPGNNSLQGLMAHFGIPAVGTVLSVLLAILVLLFIHKYKPGISSVVSLAIASSLLISPIAWTGYTLFLLPGLMLKTTWERTDWIVAAFLTVPFYIVLGLFQDSFFNFVFFGWFYGWALLALLAGEVIRTVKNQTQKSTGAEIIP